MAEKIAGSGLSYNDLERLFRQFGTEELIAILLRPLTSSSSPTPRVTRTGRILASVVKHFQESTQ